MTLREQIKEIHSKNFHKEFHEYRQNLIPAMVNDLAMKLFDDMALDNRPMQKIFFLNATVEVRAVKKARELCQMMTLREDTPAVE